MSTGNSNKRASIYERQARIAAELKAPKNQMNKFGGYKYRSCEDILEAVKPLLIKHECALTLTDEPTITGDYHYITAQAELWPWDDAEETIIVCASAREVLEKKGMDGSQVTGTASSYARKYALNGLFLIDDTKDDDTRKPTDEKPAKQAATRRAATNTGAAKTAPQDAPEQPTAATAAIVEIRNRVSNLIAMDIDAGAIQKALADEFGITTLRQPGAVTAEAAGAAIRYLDEWRKMAEQAAAKAGNDDALS